MSKKFKVWLDSGANHASCRKQEIQLSDIGLSDEDWDLMSDAEKDEVMKDIAWDRMDWGYIEID